MTAVFANFASSTLSAAITAGATSLTLRDGSAFPSPTGDQYFYAVLESRTAAGTTREIIKVTARSSNTLTVVRAQEGTSAAAFARGTTVALRITAAGLEALRASTLDDLTVPGDLLVSGTATVQGDILLNGSVVMDQSLNVGGVASIAGAATVAGDMSVGGALNVDELAVDGWAIVDEADISGTAESQPFPSGKIMKMGVATTAGAAGVATYPDGTVTVTFATPFPTQCVGVLLTVKGGTLSGSSVGRILLEASDFSAASFKIASYRASDGAFYGGVAVSWFAWGN